MQKKKERERLAALEDQNKLEDILRVRREEIQRKAIMEANQSNI